MIDLTLYLKDELCMALQLESSRLCLADRDMPSSYDCPVPLPLYQVACIC